MPLYPRQGAESLDLLLLESIQARVDSKLGKTYSGCDEIVISIYVHALICSEEEVRSVLQKVSLPASKPGTSVYAYCLTSDVGSKGYLINKLL